MRVLHLTLKKKWFDLILSGEKTEEYREIKPFWDVRLTPEYDVIKFRNGYRKVAPEMTVEFKGKFRGYGNITLGAPKNKMVFILKLGKILETKNIKEK